MSIGIARLPALAVWAAIALGVSTVAAGGTRLWELAGFDELDKGEQRQTAISSRGEVALGLKATAIDMPEVGLVWSAVAGKGDKIYLGTGYDGKIYRLDGGKAVEIATTDQLVITALAVDKRGDLFASSLPDPVIWKVADPAAIKAGKPIAARKWVEIKAPETRHIWALAFDDHGRTLFAGTGPEGRLYAVGPDRKVSVYLDTAEEHVICVVAADKGALLVGTSPEALLLRVTGPGRSTALADFDATEVKSIVLDGQEAIVAVNEFKVPPAIPSKKPLNNNPTGSNSRSSKRKSTTIGNGKLYRLRPDGRQELIWERAKAHVTALAADVSGRVFAGLGAEGIVVSVDRERVVRTELNLDERQVMALLADKSLVLAATGDAGAAYRVGATRPAEAFFLTPLLDAKSSARFGRIDWFGTGKLKVQARTGNTVEPDESWSDWSKPLANGADIGNTTARYVQLRFSWAQDGSAVLRSVELAYRPLNQRAVITELDPASPFHSAGKGSSKGSSKKKQPEVSTRTIAARPSEKHDPDLKLSWKVDNPDRDELRFRLWYRAASEKVWRPILREDEVLTRTRYEWNTESVPEGRYQIKLIADDSPSNDPTEVLADEFLSVPVLVDNHQPRVSGLKFAKGQIAGRAEDSFSAISALEFSVDGGPWMPIFSADGLFDETEEEFSFAPPGHLASGPHAIAVRAFDRTGNMGSAEIHLDVK